MDKLTELIRILSISVKKHGEKPLTNLWLLNILKLLEKEITQYELEIDHMYDDIDHF